VKRFYESFVEAVREKGAQIVCLSALLTVTMPSMKTTIEALKQAGVRDKVKVLVGGAPVTQQYADDIGADGYGESASNAVAMVRRMCGVNQAPRLLMARSCNFEVVERRHALSNGVIHEPTALTLLVGARHHRRRLGNRVPEARAGDR